jgi:hypothetical protein
MAARTRQTRAEPAGFAGSEASREGLETLPGFPSQSTSPLVFRASNSVRFGMAISNPILVNIAG